MYNTSKTKGGSTSPDKVLKVRNSRKVYIPIYFMILVLILAVAAAKFYGDEVNGLSLKLVLAFSALSLIFTEFHRYSNFYEVTPNSLIISKGIFKNSLRTVDLFSVSDADSNQGVWQRMLNYGDVRIRLFTGESSLNLKGINNPTRFVNFLLKVIDEKRGNSDGG